MKNTLSMIAAAAAMMALAACSSDAPEPGSNANANSGSNANSSVGQVDPASVQYFRQNVGDTVFFQTDSSRLTSVAQQTLQRQAAWLAQNTAVTVTVEGHADERGTREYNLALGARRAAAARSFLISQGVAASRINTISYGKERPASLCSAESCWSQNRRSVSVLAGARSS